MRRIVLLTAVLAAGLAGCGGGSSSATTSTPAPTTPSTPSTTTTQASAIDVTLHAPSQAPRAGKPWPVRITASRAGKPVDGTVSYAFLFGGAVVARRPAKPHGGHMVNGTYRDTIEFPPRAAGIPITLRVIVQSGGATGTTERQVKVQR